MISLFRAAAYLLMLLIAGLINAAQAQLSPACWSESRMLSIGKAPDEWAQGVQLFLQDTAITEPLLIQHSIGTGSVTNSATVTASRTRGGTLRVQLDHIASPVTAKRIGDSLLYIRIPWSRVTFSDVLISIDSASVILHEQMVDGQIAMDQAKASCALPEMAELPECQCPKPKPIEIAIPNNAIASSSIIGLVTIPRLFGVGETGGVVEAASITPIALRSKPDILIKPDLQIHSIDQLEWREFSYESAAAVVLNSQNGWYQLRLNDGRTGWFMGDDGNQFIPLATLFEKQLSYLTAAWPGQLWQPGNESWISEKFESFTQQKPEVIIYASRKDPHGLWFEIGILENSLCVTAEPKIIDRGWVPAWNPEGELNLWFYSRGC